MQKDCDASWNNCLQYIKENVGQQSYNTWFAPIKPLKLDKKVLTIQVPSQFFYEWLEEHYVHLLKHAIDRELGENGRLEYSIIVDKGDNGHNPFTVNLKSNKDGHPTANGQAFYKNNNANNGNSYNSPFELKTVDHVFQDSQLNYKNTFGTFIEGDCNRLARSAGYAVAKKPGLTSFNPLMVYGGVGLGKTHLVQAIGNEILNLHLQDKFVLYVSSEKFTNQFIDALRNNQVQDFSNFYLQVDVLIIDDIQFLAGKDRTQEIFFHIFNHLHQSGKQIVMTSDCPPKDLKGMAERLISRFKWGLTADLQQPDFETRMAIIQKKIQEDGLQLPHDVVEYLAYSIDTNVRELEGVLISLMANASLVKSEINLELAKQTLKNIVTDIDTEVGIDYIQKTVAEYFKVEIVELKSKSRKKEVVIPRQVSMYFCKLYTNYSYKVIGAQFGGRDHSTVIHALHAVEDMIETNPQFKNQTEELRKKLKMRHI
jgi:chromosomal replication initiator protein